MKKETVYRWGGVCLGCGLFNVPYRQDFLVWGLSTVMLTLLVELLMRVIKRILTRWPRLIAGPWPSAWPLAFVVLFYPRAGHTSFETFWLGSGVALIVWTFWRDWVISQQDRSEGEHNE